MVVHITLVSENRCLRIGLLINLLGWKRKLRKKKVSLRVQLNRISNKFKTSVIDSTIKRKMY